MTYAQLLTLAESYAGHAGRELATVAKQMGLHARVFKRLKNKKGCRHDTFLYAVEWFSANWPADLPWPSDIPRPVAPVEGAR